MKRARKLLVCMLGYLAVAICGNIVTANEANSLSETAKVELYISSLYNRIDFSNFERLSFQVFNNAMRGFLNLRNAGKLNNEKQIITICDFNQPSVLNRLWIIDLSLGKILFNTFVAHGQGTGEECAVAFSNRENSHQSSLGFYVTTEVYKGDHGTSLRLQGMDQGFNDAALKRDIVVHGADYVCEKYIAENQRLGRSWGCPAVPAKLAESIIEVIKEGTCLFIYYPDNKYLSSAYWLNKKTSLSPDPQLLSDMTPVQMNTMRYRTVEYSTNGKVDSVKRILLK